MMNIKHILTLIALLLMLTVLFCGCGKAKDETPSDESSSAQSGSEGNEEERTAQRAEMLEEHTKVMQKFAYALYGNGKVEDVKFEYENRHDGTLYSVYSFKDIKNNRWKVHLTEDSAVTLDMYLVDYIADDGTEILRKVYFEDNGKACIGESVNGEKLEEEQFKDFAREIVEAFKTDKKKDVLVERDGIVIIKSRKLIQYTVSDGSRIAFDDKLHNVYRAGSEENSVFLPLTANEDGSYAPAE
ncbi:MAG: hypothetical protein IJC94_08725 [Oscillospiraceae bacterium]|nr:hypothetical protein [Oscillospiraceae bacterium]